MLRRSKPTLSPNRFKTNEIKSLLETIQNVSNRSVLNEYGIAGGPQSSTNDPLMAPRPKKRPLGDLEIPGSDPEQEPSLTSPKDTTTTSKDTTTTSSGFGSGKQTAPKTPAITGPQSTPLGGPSTGFKAKTSSAGKFSPGQSDMAQVIGQMGTRAGKFADVGGKPNLGMDGEAGMYYAVTEPALGAALAGGAETVAKAAEKFGIGSSDVAKIAGAVALGAEVGSAGALSNAMNLYGSKDPIKSTNYLTRQKPQAPTKLK